MGEMKLKSIKKFNLLTFFLAFYQILVYNTKNIKLGVCVQRILCARIP